MLGPSLPRLVVSLPFLERVSVACAEHLRTLDPVAVHSEISHKGNDRCLANNRTTTFMGLLDIARGAGGDGMISQYVWSCQ